MILEICVDNYESLITAAENGADQIELCTSLREGGLTPPYSFIEAALKISIPIFVMIRPRSCDFLYTSDEIEMMHRDIHIVKKLGALGVVFGVLTEQGEINTTAMKSLVNAASGLAITCHRAVDQVKDIYAAIDTLAGLGVDRILSSGQAKTPFDGMDTLRQMVDYAQKRILIMAAGVRPHNVREIIEKTGVDEVHSSASTWRPSQMKYIQSNAQMGQGDDFLLKVADGEMIRAIKARFP
jgi:copper homeostasis protein